MAGVHDTQVLLAFVLNEHPPQRDGVEATTVPILLRQLLPRQTAALQALGPRPHLLRRVERAQVGAGEETRRRTCAGA